MNRSVNCRCLVPGTACGRTGTSAILCRGAARELATDRGGLARPATLSTKDTGNPFTGAALPIKQLMIVRTNAPVHPV